MSDRDGLSIFDDDDDFNDEIDGADDQDADESPAEGSAKTPDTVQVQAVSQEVKGTQDTGDDQGAPEDATRAMPAAAAPVAPAQRQAPQRQAPQRPSAPLPQRRPLPPGRHRDSPRTGRRSRPCVAVATTPRPSTGS